MKLRIAHIDDSQRMAGKFAVQSSFFGILWDTMYFNSVRQELLEEFELGKYEIVKAIFDDFDTAFEYAQRYKQFDRHKQIIRETWRV